ncbi:hypothetical protein MiSe_54950 [Microseira wollei NIES-4236]|uniref:Uncharacterized protein n=1 Tax=Microseira wollei NIES-4236 TaxID=2530354 RepID=A0AAV3XEC2_9CYAN|nr:hypothetical protein MiSe_54950 [Microseira wollei NIES-4236]
MRVVRTPTSLGSRDSECYVYSGLPASEAKPYIMSGINGCVNANS